MGEFLAKHEDAISTTKKKQWVSSQLNTKMHYPLLRKAMGEFLAKHKDAISASRKKQWVS